MNKEPELIKHNCPVEGSMMTEKGKPCNWCDKLDKEKHLKVVNNGNK